jgi:hypothetical protein
MAKTGKAIIPRARLVFDVPMGAWRVDYLEPIRGGYREYSRWHASRDQAVSQKEQFELSFALEL